VVSILLLGVLFGNAPHAQEQSSFGFLVRQPQRGRGVPILPANAIRFIEAQYDVGGMSVDVFITTHTTSSDLASTGPNDWVSVSCSELPMQRYARSTGNRYVVRSGRDQYGLYVSTTVDSDQVCRFAVSFVETFEFFLEELDGDLSEGPPPEFPAVIDLTQ
jgi:hypothetical protein